MTSKGLIVGVVNELLNLIDFNIGRLNYLPMIESKLMMTCRYYDTFIPLSIFYNDT